MSALDETTQKKTSVPEPEKVFYGGASDAVGDSAEAAVFCHVCQCKVKISRERLNSPNNRCPQCNALLTASTMLTFSDGGGNSLTSDGPATIFLVSNMLNEGDILDKYKIISLLGKGGMAEVYLAEHILFQRKCAIKLMHRNLSLSDPVFTRRFIREAKLAHDLESPYIVRVLDAGTDFRTGHLFLAMEYIEGQTLQELSCQQTFSEQELREILYSMALALQVMDKDNIVHRDIKPSNIMRTTDGVYKLMDLGIAKADTFAGNQMTLTMEQSTIGTPGYASPEQCRSAHNANIRSDIYSLGATVYHLAGGIMPFNGDTPVEIIIKVLQEEPEPLKTYRPDLSPELLQLISWMMKKNPEERPASPAELLEYLSPRKNDRTDMPDTDASGDAAECEEKNEPQNNWKKNLENYLQLILKLTVLLALFMVIAVAGNFIYSTFSRETPEPPRPPQDPPQITQVPVQEKEPVEEPVKEKTPPAETPRPEYDERRISALIQEAYHLQSNVLQKKREFEAAKYAPAQETQKYVDLLNENFTAGEQALKNHDISSAKSSFENADQAADWLLANAPHVKTIKSLHPLLKEQIVQAEKINAPKLRAEECKIAKEKIAQSEKACLSGDFSAAVLALQSALADYKKICVGIRESAMKHLTFAVENAKRNRQWDSVKNLAAQIRKWDPKMAEGLIQLAEKQSKIDKIERELVLARRAKVEKKWENVRKHAIAALKSSPANTEALNLQIEAENNLCPTLAVNVYVNGKKVNAVIKALKTEPDRTVHPWKLKKGKAYAFEVFYRDSQGRYCGEIPVFTCTQNGLHFKKLTLKKMFDGIVEYKGIKLEMVKIKAGSFTMGSPENELSRDNDEIPHKVTLTRDFWLGKYEVTQMQYTAVMNTNPSEFKGFKRPVEMVSYDDAKEFCKRLNQLYADRLPNGYRFDLPTEAQWEYACRAGTSTALNNGSDLTTDSGECSNLNAVGWYYDNRGSEGHKEVGLKHPNAWGLYDMHGNVYEWCRDWYGPYKGNARDPVGPDKGTYRVLRGGGWDISARRCRAAFRFNDKPNYKLNYIGFRLALVAVQ